MKLRPLFAAMIVALLGAVLFAPSAALAAKKGDFLENVPVNQSFADGSSFVGTVSVNQLSYDNGLRVSGLLKGTFTDASGTATEIKQNFKRVRATLNEGGGVAAFAPAAQGSCEILDLDIGAISIDLLGLQIDLAPIALDIVAQSGAGNLLGNLLCAVVGLLDPNGFLNFLTDLGRLLDLLNQINQIIR